MQFLAVHKAHTTVQLQNLQPFSSSYTVTFLDLTDDQDLGCRLCKEDYFLCQQSIQMLIFLLLPRKIQYSVQLGKKEKKFPNPTFPNYKAITKCPNFPNQKGIRNWQKNTNFSVSKSLGKVKALLLLFFPEILRLHSTNHHIL